MLVWEPSTGTTYFGPTANRAAIGNSHSPQLAISPQFAVSLPIRSQSSISSAVGPQSAAVSPQSAIRRKKGRLARSRPFLTGGPYSPAARLRLVRRGAAVFLRLIGTIPTSAAGSTSAGADGAGRGCL